MNKLLKQTLVCAGTLLLSMQVAAKPSSEAKEVRGIIDKVNTYWQTHNKPEVRSFWDNAAYHTGNMEAYFLTGNENYRAYSEAWAIHNEWKGAKERISLNGNILTVRVMNMYCSEIIRFVFRHISTFILFFRTTIR